MIIINNNNNINNNDNNNDDDDNNNNNNNNGNAFSVQCIFSSFCHELLVTPTKSNLLSLVEFN